MKKKSLVAMGLAGVMTVGMCVPVLAADFQDGFTDITKTDDTIPTVNRTDLQMDVPSQYTVNIPTKIKVDSDGTKSSINITAKSTILKDNNILEISVPTSKVELSLDDADSTKYIMKFNKGQVKDDSSWQLCTFENSLTADKTEIFSLEQDENQIIKKAGTYTGTVQFSINEIESVTP